MFLIPLPQNLRIAEQVSKYLELPKKLHNLPSVSYQSHEDDLLSFAFWKECVHEMDTPLFVFYLYRGTVYS